MIGAIAGDIIGSVYERHNVRRTDFPLFHPRSRFTDDTILTVAVADALLTETDYAKKLRDYCRSYPSRGYGFNFYTWAASDDSGPYNSLGNGSAMRVSPVAYARDTLGAVLGEARRSAEATHNHPEGIKGAQATALAVFLARQGFDKDTIRTKLQEGFGYNISRTVDSIRSDYGLDVTCQGSVPESIIAFLDSTSFEDAVRNAVSLGGDADTQACIAGAIAEAYYKEIPLDILRQVRRRLEEPLWKKILDFYARFGAREIVDQIYALDEA